MPPDLQRDTWPESARVRGDVDGASLLCREPQDLATLLAEYRAHTTPPYRLLAPLVPPGIRYDLHLALITHGRTVCRAQRPRCDTCVVRDLCAYGSTAHRDA